MAGSLDGSQRVAKGELHFASRLEPAPGIALESALDNVHEFVRQIRTVVTEAAALIARMSLREV